VAREVKVVLGVLVLALAFAGWAGVTWWQASRDDSLAYATARDEVLATGRAQVATLTTLDYHDVDAGIDKWLAVSTGGLRDELAATDGATRKQLADNATVATGRVLDAAVSELDTRSGSAKLLVSVEISTAKDGSPPTAKRNRFLAAMSRVDGEWKLSALDQVQVGER
jgi:Mce-associated membrane protein